MYYDNKIESFKNIFGTKNVVLNPHYLVINGIKYPIIHDVVILSEPGQYTDFVRTQLQLGTHSIPNHKQGDFAEDVQFTFGEEWQNYDKILVEYEKEFSQYFDIIDLDTLRNCRVCDLGCGIGRWSYFLKDICKELVLVDFSNAIFVARKNLSGADNCLFFMGDLKRLPFKNNFVDFLFCLGVLHHLPTPCLNEVRNLQRFAPRLLVFLYYALDNRPLYFRLILQAITLLRQSICKIRNPIFRKVFAQTGTFLLYLPLILVGHLLKPLKLSSYIPLYDFYYDKSVQRIEQDVYDRFFTPIEQRVSRKEILELQDTFSSVLVSNKIPYWHFLCCR